MSIPYGEDTVCVLFERHLLQEWLDELNRQESLWRDGLIRRYRMHEYEPGKVEIEVHESYPVRLLRRRDA